MEEEDDDDLGRGILLVVVWTAAASTGSLEEEFVLAPCNFGFTKSARVSSDFFFTREWPVLLRFGRLNERRRVPLVSAIMKNRVNGM